DLGGLRARVGGGPLGRAAALAGGRHGRLRALELGAKALGLAGRGAPRRLGRVALRAQVGQLLVEAAVALGRQRGELGFELLDAGALASGAGRRAQQLLERGELAAPARDRGQRRALDLARALGPQRDPLGRGARAEDCARQLLALARMACEGLLGGLAPACDFGQEALGLVAHRARRRGGPLGGGELGADLAQAFARELVARLARLPRESLV